MTRLIFPGAALLLILASGCGHRRPSDSDLFNQPAAIAASKLPFNPLSWKIITSSIDTQRHTMSALLGNDLAIRSARAGHPGYPDGAVLSLVTWSQREDPHWFGGRIPDGVQTIEFVMVGGKDAGTSYQRYEGPHLQPARPDAQFASARRDAILAERAAVMP